MMNARRGKSEQVEHHLERIERELVGLKRTNAILMLVLLVVSLVASVGWQSRAPKKLRAESIELVNENGELRLLMSAYRESADLAFYDGKKHTRVHLSSHEFGLGLRVFDTGGMQRVRITDRGIELADSTQDPRAALLVDRKGDCYLSFDRGGNELYRIPPKRDQPVLASGY